MRKLYYDINEVAEMVQCEPSALRFWEKKFPQLKPKRDARQRRRYTDADIDIIKKIIYQRDNQGRTIEGAKNQLSHREETQNLINRLKRVRDFLTEIKDNLD